MIGGAGDSYLVAGLAVHGIQSYPLYFETFSIVVGERTSRIDLHF
jgi:hypothetical protein